MKILITGVSGFVGGHLGKMLSAPERQIIGIYRNTEPKGSLRGYLDHVVRVDCADHDEIQRVVLENEPDLIIHAAARARLGDCEKDPDEAWRDNLVGSLAVLGAVEALPTARIIFLSTDLVFDGAEAPSGGFLESMQPMPRSVYGKSKAAAEAEFLTSPCCALIARLCLVAGNEFEGREGFMGWLRGGLENGQTVSLFQDEYRTPVCIEDIAMALSGLIDDKQEFYELSASNPVLHFAGEERLSRVQMGQVLCRFGGFDPKLIKETCAPADRSRDLSLSAKKTSERLGVKFRGFSEWVASEILP